MLLNNTMGRGSQTHSLHTLTRGTVKSAIIMSYTLEPKRKLVCDKKIRSEHKSCDKNAPVVSLDVPACVTEASHALFFAPTTPLQEGAGMAPDLR